MTQPPAFKTASQASAEYQRLAALADEKRAAMIDGKGTRNAWFRACNKAEKVFFVWLRLLADERASIP